jgi:hypothetical protein
MEPSGFPVWKRILRGVAGVVDRNQWLFIIAGASFTGFFAPVPGPSWMAFVAGGIAAVAVGLALNVWANSEGAQPSQEDKAPWK